MQATGLKGEVVPEQASKRPKMGTAADVAKLASSQLSEFSIGMASLHAETVADKINPLGNHASQSPKASAIISHQESTALKQPIRPFAPVNRYKLDNRPTAFKITPPLPAGLANVSPLSLSLMK